ncbi:hypothetical protein Tco_0168019 [Tanacetum coccineum]
MEQQEGFSVSWERRKPYVQVEEKLVRIKASTEIMISLSSIVLPLYVDDMLVAGSDMAEMKKLKSYPQKKYIGKVLKKFNMKDAEARCGTAVSWMSRIQKCVAMSTTKAEYMDIADDGKEDIIFEEDSWSKEPCRYAHQGGDNREVEAQLQLAFKITDEWRLVSYQREVIPSLIMLVQDTLYQKSPSPVFG